MTLEELIASLQNAVATGTDPKSIVRAWDPELNGLMPVTGYTHGGIDNKLDLYTDDDHDRTALRDD